jgi:hypothetical protein
VLDPRLEYGGRLASHVETIQRRERQHILIGNLKLAALVVFFLLAWLRYIQHVTSARWLIAPALTYAALAVLHEYAIGARTRAETAAAFDRAGFARMENRVARAPRHVCAEDLDLFGDGCLFQLSRPRRHGEASVGLRTARET